MTNWDKRFLELAEHVAQWSKDPSTKVGAVIVDSKKRVVSLGYNGFPRGVHDCRDNLNNRDQKYKRVIHAEPNAILFAQKDLTDCSIYTWPFQPCSACTTLIIQSCIKRVVAPAASDELRGRWKESMAIAEEMFKEAGVKLIITGKQLDLNI